MSIIYDSGWMEFSLSQDLEGEERCVISFDTEPYNRTLDGENLVQNFEGLVAILGEEYVSRRGRHTLGWRRGSVGTMSCCLNFRMTEMAAWNRISLSRFMSI